jgi:pimeloyl-ACP methyl ester carboxylesterase
MTLFLDVRLQPVGGELARHVACCQGTSIANYTGILIGDLQNAIHGRDVLIATHGFNVNREGGIASLSNWGNLLQLGPGAVFVGLLWPGDSIWAHGLDYPGEARVADDAGALVGPFVDAYFAGAASVSFASHSLGARVVLATIANMKTRVRRLTLMAGAIDDDCLNGEFKDAAANIGTISVLASMKDTVLSRLFPLGNFVAGILTQGHPWWHAAIGHCGPEQTWPGNFEAPFMIPDAWNFDHGNYLQINTPPMPTLALPLDVPQQGAATPARGETGWQEAFTAGFESSRFRQR